LEQPQKKSTIFEGIVASKFNVRFFEIFPLPPTWPSTTRFMACWLMAVSAAKSLKPDLAHSLHTVVTLESQNFLAASAGPVVSTEAGERY